MKNWFYITNCRQYSSIFNSGHQPASDRGNKGLPKVTIDNFPCMPRYPIRFTSIQYSNNNYAPLWTFLVNVRNLAAMVSDW